jgi:integrase
MLPTRWSCGRLKQIGAKFCELYDDERLKEPKRYRREAKTILKVRVYPHIGNRVVSSLEADDIETLKSTLLKKLSPASVRLAMATLSRMCVWARRKKYIACANPVEKVPRPSSEASIEYLSPEDVTALLAHAEQHAEPVAFAMIAFCVFTGARKGEAFGARWQDVHLDAAQIHITRSYKLAPKSGKARKVPLHPELARVLREWKEKCPATDAGLVFPVGRGRMGDRWELLGLRMLMRKAGCKTIPAHPWHALRHTYASHLVMAGASLYDVQRLLGHSTPTVTQVYAHLSPDHLAAQVARLSYAQPVAADVPDLGEKRRRRAAAEDTGRTTATTDAKAEQATA